MLTHKNCIGQTIVTRLHTPLIYHALVIMYVKVINTTLIFKFFSTLAKLQQHETRATAHTKARGP